MSRSQLPPNPFAGPPPEVLDEVGAAWERAQAPLIDSLELAFASEAGVRRAWGELRLPDGTVLAAIPASEAIAIACGDVFLQAASV